MSYPYMQQENNYPKALGIAGGIMGFLVLISFFIMIGNRLPQFGMGGMVVNYGTAEFGMGDDYMTVDDPSMHPNANEVNPDIIDPNMSPDISPSQQISDRSVVTQDSEDAPAVTSNETKMANATETTVDKKESQPTVNPNALYRGRPNSSTGRGDGTSNVVGNQGSELGDPIVAVYGEGGSGDGNLAISLESRRMLFDELKDDGQQVGVVRIAITVDPNGNVTYAQAGVRGTTIVDVKLMEKLDDIIKRAKFNQIRHSPNVQRAVIQINFKVR